jgi:hypothetical protein
VLELQQGALPAQEHINTGQQQVQLRATPLLLLLHLLLLLYSVTRCSVDSVLNTALKQATAAAAGVAACTGPVAPAAAHNAHSLQEHHCGQLGQASSSHTREELLQLLQGGGSRDLV